MKLNLKNTKFLYLEHTLVLFILFFIYSVIRYDEDVIGGLYKIFRSSSILITDYLAIGGLSATLLNIILVLSVNLFIIHKCKIKVRGVAFAALWTVIGFSFFGKNVISILPIYLGAFLYSKFEGEHFKKYFIIAMFATGLAPSVSFGFDTALLNYFIGACIGIIYGFIIPTFSTHVISFHRGYTLYNIGFAGGVFAMLLYGAFTLLGIEFTLQYTTTYDYSLDLTVFLAILTGFFLLVSNVNRGSTKTYGKLLSMSGRAITDFTMIFGNALTFFNIALLSTLCLAIVLITRVEVNGVIIGSIFTVIGFGTFGKHIRNVMPIIISIIAIGYFKDGEINGVTLITAFFATTLAPIAGDFGFFAGIIAGILHYGIASRSAIWQGGMNLYNNGFASGFVAAFLSSIFDTIEPKSLLMKWGKNNEAS